MEKPETIVSPKNPFVRRAAELKDKGARDERQRYLAEGRRILQDLDDASLCEEIFVKAEKPELFALTDRFSCPVRVVSDAAFRVLSDTVNGEGIAAVLKKRPEDFNLGSRALVLDHVGDPANVGTLTRSAAAFGFRTVVSVGSADFYNPKVVRGSMGAVTRLNLFNRDEDALPALLQGFALYAADMAGEELKTVAPPARLALVVGNEARGISPKFVAMATKLVKISMPGGMESLNAGVAGSIAMYHFISGGRYERTQQMGEH